MALARCLLMRGARLKDKSAALVSAAAQLQCSHFSSSSAASTSALTTQERIAASSALATTSSSGRVFAAGAAAAAAAQHAEHIFAHGAARSTSSASSYSFAFAALAAVLVGSAGVALADAAADPDLAAALQDARAHLNRAYAELSDDWARLTAMRRPGAKPQAPPLPPSAELSPGGGGGGSVRLTLPLRPGADAAAVVREVSSALGQLARGSASCRQRQHVSIADGVALHTWDVTHTPPGAATQHSLSVEASLPLRSLRGGGGGGTVAGGDSSSSPPPSVVGPGGDGGEALAARVVVSKGGALLPSEKWAVTRILRAAALTSEDLSHRGGDAGAEDPLAALLGRAERALAAELSRLPGLLGGGDAGFRDLGSFFEFVEGRAAELSALFGSDDDDDGDEEGVPGNGEFARAWREHASAAAAAAAAAARAAEADAAEAARLRALKGPAGGASASVASGQRQQQQQQKQQEEKQQEEDARPVWERPEGQRAVEALRAMGARVYLPGGADDVDWGALAGYEEQKRAIEDTLLLPLKHPEVYDSIAAGTRAAAAVPPPQQLPADGDKQQQSSPPPPPRGCRPRAVLFEGPPGTGKTTSARVLSTGARVPLVYVPLESLASKWYGESERNLAAVFKHAAALGGALLFLDELDALATSRGRGEMHEASRRLLAVLLREIDGFEASTSVVVGATNRRADLDPALLSRFSLSLAFGLPSEPCRAAIIARYARQLGDVDRSKLAARTPGFSGRDLRDVCEQAERRWASKILRGAAPRGSLPPLSEYEAAADERAASSAVGGGGEWRGGGPPVVRL